MGEALNRLLDHHRIGIDTPLFIYYSEPDPFRTRVSGEILTAVETGRIVGITSVITLVEIMTKPLQLGQFDVADAYDRLLHNTSNLLVAPVDAGVARIASRLRAEYGISTPDAIQIACSIQHGATSFVTNDRRLKKVRIIEVVILDDLLNS